MKSNRFFAALAILAAHARHLAIGCAHHVHAALFSHMARTGLVAFAVDEEVGRELKRINDDVAEPLKALKARVTEIEMKQDRTGGGGGGDDGEPGENVGNLLLKEGHFEAMREGKLKSFRVGVKAFPLGRKSTLTSSDFPGQAYRDPEMYSPLARRFSVRDLLVTKPTTQGSIEFLQSTRTGGAAVQVTEGAVKADISIGFVLKNAPVRTIACWIPASRQILDDNAQLVDFVNTQLLDALQLTEDMQLLSADGTGANILGLLPQATPFARYKSNGETSIDQLRRAATQIQLARGVASGIVLNPVDLETIELTKDNDGRYIIELDVTDGNGRTILWRTPVVVTDAIQQGTFLIGDFTRAARLYDRQQANVEVATEHADFFVRNLVAVLAEERVALTVPRPDLLVTGSFNPPTNRLPATPGPLLPA